MQFSNFETLRPRYSFKSLNPILGLYFYTLGTVMLGFSVYLFSLTNNSNNLLTSWIGETIFCSLIIFFVSLFLLFLPSEFFSITKLNNSNFSDLVLNIIIVIFLSLLSLVLSQFLNQESLLFDEVRSIIRSVSFSGFITIHFVLFIFHNFLNKIGNIKDYTFSLLLMTWILSAQFFL